MKEQGVTKYLYENEEYLEEIRRGTIICEGIDVEEIKNMLFGSDTRKECDSHELHS